MIYKKKESHINKNMLQMSKYLSPSILNSSDISGENLYRDFPLQ